MDDSLIQYLLLALAGLGAAAALLFVMKRSGAASQKGAFTRHPLTPLADVVPGQPVRVRGRIKAIDAPLTSPISGRDCVAWRVGYQYDNDDDRRVGGSTQGAQPFLLEENGVSVWIDTAFIKLHLSSQAQNGEGASAYMSRIGYSTASQVTEGILLADAPVVVVGIGRMETLEDGTQRLRIECLDDGHTMASNLPDVLEAE